MKKFFIFLIIIFFFFIFSSKIFAELRLNEIYPAPPTGEYEWVELYNDEDKIINTSQYQVLDLAGNKVKITTSSALPFSFILATSSSVLNNSGDTVYLKRGEDIIEIATYSANFDSEKTFAKCPDFYGQWFILNLPTKNASNESVCQILTPTPTFSPTQTPTIFQSPTPEISPISYYSPTPNHTPTPTFALISYQNIYLSEVHPNPQTGENEWVEIYNDNDFSVSLTNWYIDDVEDSGASPKKISLTIPAKNYAVFDLSTAIFNNDQDSVRLLDFEKKEKDSFEYKNSQKGKSFGRISFENDEFCLQEPSKNQKNNLCLNPTPTKNSTLNPTLTSLLFSSITTEPTKTNLNLIKPSNQDRYIYQNYYQTLNNIKKTDKNDLSFVSNKTDILGLYNKRKTSRYSFLPLISICYSMLSAFGIIIKIIKHFS